MGNLFKGIGSLVENAKERMNGVSDFLHTQRTYSGEGDFFVSIMRLVAILCIIFGVTAIAMLFF